MDFFEFWYISTYFVYVCARAQNWVPCETAKAIVTTPHCVVTQQ